MPDFRQLVGARFICRRASQRFHYGWANPTDGWRVMHKKDDNLHQGPVDITEAFLTGSFVTEVSVPDPDSEIA